MPKSLLIILGILLFPSLAKAQWDPNLICVDSNRINDFYRCNVPEFEPVCGCNGVTYRNECEAYNRFGVNRNRHEGVCQEDYFYVDIVQNPIFDQINFDIAFFGQTTKALYTIFIFNMKGEIVFMQKRNYDAFTPPSSINFNGRPQGFYIFVVESGGYYKYRKIVKAPAK